MPATAARRTAPLALAFVLTLSCSGGAADVAGAPDAGLAASVVLRHGEDVEAVGEVGRVLAPHAFTIRGGTIGDPVLVVAANSSIGMQPGQAVAVSGTVVLFEVARYEADLGVDLVNVDFVAYRGQPAVQADAVTTG